MDSEEMDQQVVEDLGRIFGIIEEKAQDNVHMRLDAEDVVTLFQYMVSASEVMARNEQYAVFLEQELETERNKKRKLWRPNK